VWVVLAVSSFGIAVVFSMLGLGGGVLYTPLQVWLGIDFHQAATTSLFLIMVTSLSASLVFHKAGKIDWPLAIVLETVTAAGAFGGGLMSAWLSGATLSILFAVVVALAALFMIRPLKERPTDPEGPSGFFRWRRTMGKRSYRVNLAIALPISVAAGFLSALMGVGGGVLKVPMMVLALGIPADIAVGSSAFMVGLTASSGFAGHLLNGHWNWRLSLILAGAVFVGGQIGSRLSIHLGGERLKRGFGWFLILIAATMLFRAFG
jgi:uncharacterized membrane protein YfcA